MTFDHRILRNDWWQNLSKRVTWPRPRPLGIVCHPKSSIRYIILAYKIWQLPLQLFRRYDWGHQNWKSFTWCWPRPS